MPSLKVKGMSCEHCRKSVTEAVSALPGVGRVEVDLLSGLVTFEQSGETDMEKVRQAVAAIGFEPE